MLHETNDSRKELREWNKMNNMAKDIHPHRVVACRRTRSKCPRDMELSRRNIQYHGSQQDCLNLPNPAPVLTQEHWGCFHSMPEVQALAA